MLHNGAMLLQDAVGDLRHGESFGMESRLNVALVSR